MERDLARTRTREALRQKASRGHVAGGKLYGLPQRQRGARHRRPQVRDRVKREIVPAEAALDPTDLFQEIARGRGFSRVAKGLNAEAVPCPAHDAAGPRAVSACWRSRPLPRPLVWGPALGRSRGTEVKQDVPASDGWCSSSRGCGSSPTICGGLPTPARPHAARIPAAHRRPLLGRPASPRRGCRTSWARFWTRGAVDRCTPRTDRPPGRTAAPLRLHDSPRSRRHLCPNAVSAPMDRLEGLG